MKDQISLTVTGCYKEIVGKSAKCTYHGCVHDFKLLILKLEVALEQFIDSEIGCMGRDTTTGNDLRTLPEP